MKLVALLAFRNEEEFLKQNIPQLIEFCDIVLGHDDNSTDKSREVFSDLGGVIIPHARSLQWGNGGEFQVRHALLLAGRKLGGTHFICIDADEIFTSDVVGELRAQILTLAPGSALSLKWISCWANPINGKLAYDPHSVDYKDFIFADREDLQIPRGLIHFSRTPTNATSHVQSNCSGGVLHLQNFNHGNFIAKQLWYQLSEIVFSNHPYYYLDYKYLSYTERPQNLVVLDDGWVKGLPQMISNSNLSMHWHSEIIKMLHDVEERQIQYLGMWRNPELATIYKQFYGVAPRKIPLVISCIDAVRLRIFLMRSKIATWRCQNSR
jgi:hypothetical protein